ncbi:MAG: hypothetical protein IJ688_10080 [Treponema sp.]|nr:hypothetical protein [Treponema sp.]
MKNKIKISLILFFLFLFSAFAKSGNNTQIIPAGHWLYDDLFTICSETKRVQFLTNQPLSVGELKFYLYDVPYEELSFQGKILFDRIKDYLNSSSDFFPEQDLRFYTNLRLNPEFYYKSNPDIDWSFNYNYRDFLINIPVIMGFSDYITIEPDLFIGKNYPSMQKWWNFTNIPYSGNQFEFLTPRFAYGSTGLTFENWGVNFHAGKEGMQIGTSQLGSIIYNNTFETDAYFQLNLFTKWLKYTMDVVQVCNTKFFYVHQLDIRLFRNLKFGMIEGSLLNSSFELRYLNPFMLMHQFGSWNDYGSKMTALESRLYGEGHFCAYLAFTLDYVPVKNVRIYGLYAQNEIQDLGGKPSDYDLSVPDSLGGQLGLEIKIPFANGYINNFLESTYASPYLYIKQSPDWSLWRTRKDMQTGKQVTSWMGLPYGPDTFAVKTGSSYKEARFEFGFDYLFLIKGQNDASIFFNKTSIEGEDIYTYYPSVEYKTAQNDEERLAARNKGRYMWMTGIPEFTNQFTISGAYKFLETLEVYGQIAYSLVYNNSHEKGAFSQGAEVSVGVEWKILK